MMTRQEAEEIVKQVQKGKSFGIKFRNDEWGIRYNASGQFEKWTRIVEVFTNDDGNKDLCQNYETKIIVFEDLISILCRFYDYNDILSKLRED